MPRRLLLVALVLLLSAAPAFAQGPTGVQQAAQMLNACAVTATATGVANTTVTATVPAIAGQFFNICSMEFTVVANAAVTGAAAPAQLYTTTNLPTNLVFWGNNTTLVIGDSRDSNHFYALPIKTAQPGVPFTIVGTGGQSTQTIRINASGFYSY